MDGRANATAGAKIKTRKLYGANGKTAGNIRKIQKQQGYCPDERLGKYFLFHFKISGMTLN